MWVCQLSSGTVLHLDENPLGRGGEGHVHAVLQPAELRHCVVKRYHPAERKAYRATKLRYMAENPPLPSAAAAIVWVQDLVYEAANFVGFLMPRAEGAYDLSVLCALKLSALLDEDWQARYGREQAQNLAARFIIGQNLAQALCHLHQRGQYVVVDLKPENIRVALNGQLSLIDMDSVAVMAEGKLKFAAEKLTTEYSPPERTHIDYRKELIPETWDRFSLAVILYKLLLGLHPFTATGRDEWAACDNYAQKIEAGLFPHGSRAKRLAVVPKPHENFAALPAQVQALFLRSFDEGLEQPEKRPSALEWLHALQSPLPPQLTRHYQNPLEATSTPSPARRVGPSQVEKAVLSRDFNYWPFLLLNVVNLFNGFEILPPLGITGLALGTIVLGVGVGIYSIKYAQALDVDPKAKKLLVHYQNILGRKIRRSCKLEKIEATFGEEHNRRKILRIYQKVMWDNRKEIAHFIVYPDGRNERVVLEMVALLNRYQVPVKAPNAVTV
ncbi:MAG: hypothetical protein HC913_11090 [Microscillaceae bacterium]|nr:hypothetical protein [Microscillaceae bacterium]